MAGECVVCHEKEADHRCIQCHKPVCDDCAFKDDQGVFCGRDCSAAYRSYKDADTRAGGKKSSSLRIVLLILVIIAVLVFLWILGKKQGKGPFASLPGDRPVAGQLAEA